MIIARAASCLLVFLLIINMNTVRIRAMPATTYEQPLYGFAWPTRDIPVIMEKSSDYARNAVLNATRIWNLAQIWFSTTYGVTSRPYRFVEVEQPGQSYVNMTFNQTQTRDDWGYTWWHYSNDSRGVFYKITISISLDLTLRDGRSLTFLEIQALAAHELGHALGLNHTVFSETDLMNHFSPGHRIAIPSTLNLYALALLSMADSRNDMPKSPVALPQGIPYGTPPESAVPEIPFPLITLTLTLGIAITIIKYRKTRNKSLG